MKPKLIWSKFSKQPAAWVKSGFQGLNAHEDTSVECFNFTIRQNATKPVLATPFVKPNDIDSLKNFVCGTVLQTICLHKWPE